MAPSLLELVSALPDNNSWGPPVTTETTLNGVPYAPFSKGDKLGRMADWTEGKDRERGGRQQYGNRGYRGKCSGCFDVQLSLTIFRCSDLRLAEHSFRHSSS
jgi:Eukaryotic translation initiation factor 3 subunit 7 (eIF-3)